MLCEDTKQIVMSYHCNTNIDKDILYSNYYDNLYNYLMTHNIGYLFKKDVSDKLLKTFIQGESRSDLNQIKNICKPNVFNYMQFSNINIKSWFQNFQDSTFLKYATEEFAELFYDHDIIDNYFIEIMKIKIFRQNLQK